MPAKRAAGGTGEPPERFRITRDLPVGRHPLPAAFPGIGALETARRLEPDDAAREKLLEETCVEIVSEDVWMYVAPWHVPKTLRRWWKPHVSPGSDCIVIGQDHLRESAPLVLFLDIFHELCHVRQRHAGHELFDRKESYVRRPTEIEAYRFAVDEARALGVTDQVLRDYLRVEWVSDDELLELYRAVGVPAAP